MSLYYFHRKLTSVYCILIFFACFPLFGEKETSFCVPPWDLDKIADCGVKHHPEFKMEVLRLKEIQGRKKISSYFFPSNPNVSGYVSKRSAASELIPVNSNHANNFQVMVSQEIYVGGKRETSIRIADEEFKTQAFRLESVRRNLYFRTLSLLARYTNYKKEEEVTRGLYDLTKEITRLAQARVKEGLAPAMDETLALSEELRMAKLWQQSKRKTEQSHGEISILLGLPTEKNFVWEGSFHFENGLPGEKEKIIEIALRNRPEISLSEKEIQLAMLRLEEVKLQKIPNLSFGAFVQNDGFNERVIGGQVSMPLTLWRDYEGETLVAKSKQEQSLETKESVERIIKQEVINAVSNYLTLKEEYSLFSKDILKQTDTDLQFLKEALRLGQIKVIDALNSQRVLYQTKLNHSQTGADFALSQIELVRVLGLEETTLTLGGKL
ncbi:TolC family protein [Leptospira idonii]|uniref:TolC family protein n=1 Tax=Leptospira idonii TaxID=1193500 RepID=A0A4R9LWN5_9LEPT|nr:TolC family protein [Leptospira idonii]TGN17377.1 TolC family protein [Leptospira idonii]